MNAIVTQRPEAALLIQWGEDLRQAVNAGDISSTTATTYKRGMAVFYKWLVANSVEVVTGTTVQNWKSELLLAGARPNSVNAWLAGVKRYFEWAVGAGLLAANPASGVKNVNRRGSNKKHLRDKLTDHEIIRVLAQPDRASTQGKRDYAILCLMAFCALREVEVQRADFEDLSTIDGLPVLRVQGKGRSDKDETAVIWHPAAQAAVYDWLGVRGGEPGCLFTSLSPRSKGQCMSSRAVRSLVSYLRKAGVVDKRKTLHSLRHSAIDKVARHDILKAKQVARHSSIETTMIYVHEADRLDNPGEQWIDYTNSVNGA